MRGILLCLLLTGCASAKIVGTSPDGYTVRVTGSVGLLADAEMDALRVAAKYCEAKGLHAHLVSTTPFGQRYTLTYRCD